MVIFHSYVSLPEGKFPHFFSSRLLSHDTLQQIDVDMNIQFIVLIFLMEMETMGFEY